MEKFYYCSPRQSIIEIDETEFYEKLKDLMYLDLKINMYKLENMIISEYIFCMLNKTNFILTYVKHYID